MCVCSRHRLSEADEEDDLLEEEELSGKTITRFNQNPWCEYRERVGGGGGR